MIVKKCEELIDRLKEAIETEALKCENGNASAGRRLRKSLMEISKEIKELRLKILEHTKK